MYVYVCLRIKLPRDVVSGALPIMRTFLSTTPSFFPPSDLTLDENNAVDNYHLIGTIPREIGLLTSLKTLSFGTSRIALAFFIYLANSFGL